MFVSVLIIAVSLILFVYWFRYTCLLVLQTELSLQHVGSAVEANNLKFPLVRDDLERGRLAFDEQYAALESDYRIVSYLLDNASGFRSGSIEERMLLADFRLMQIWYRVTRNALQQQAQSSLSEMSSILGYFADRMGRRILAES